MNGCNPKVSVIMPVYNAEQFIKKTIQNILNQSFKDFELILIDDKATDNSMSIVDEFNDKRIRIIHNIENKGIAFSRNIGIKEAKGEYIALMDDDDLSPINRFQLQVEYLDSHLDIGVVGGGVRIIDANDKDITMGEIIRFNNPLFIKAQLLFANMIANGSAMFRKEIIIKNEITYKDGCFGLEDYRFWVDVSLCAKMTNLQDILLYWRQAQNSETINVRKNNIRDREEEYAQIQKYALQMNGFDLTEEELRIYTETFPEMSSRIRKTETEIIQIYRILQKIIKKAFSLNLSNKLEIIFACRKRFSKIVEYSTMWFPEEYEKKQYEK